MKKILLSCIGLTLTIANTALAHPTGSDSILDQNIVSIDLKNDINIPPNHRQVVIVEKNKSYCVLNMNKAVGYDRMIRASNVSVSSVVLKNDRHSDEWHFYNDNYVVFNIASKKSHEQRHPEIANILCGYGEVSYYMDDLSNVRRLFEIPTLTELNSVAATHMNFNHGETMDITGQ